MNFRDIRCAIYAPMSFFGVGRRGHKRVRAEGGADNPMRGREREKQGSFSIEVGL